MIRSSPNKKCLFGLLIVRFPALYPNIASNLPPPPVALSEAHDYWY
ncbi:hypothetical protein SNE23_25765 [Bacillus sp. RA(2023)]|nr:MULTISPECIES: hypothetical protein [Bacillus]WPU74776.1 hypothetical protein SNE23_25765 [Bacillus sp. RA(2023)]